MRLILPFYRLGGGQRVSFKKLLFSLSSLMALLLAGCSNPAVQTPGVDQASPGSPAPGVIKVLVNADGIYKIDAPELQAAGFDAKALDFKKASLTLDGTPVPVWLQPENGAQSLYFYGTASTSRYTASNVYWLKFDGTPSPQLHTGSQPGQQAGTATLQKTYTRTLHTEPQNFYSPQVVKGDHWFWVTLPAPVSQVFEISLDQVAVDPGPQSLKINLYGSTQASQNPDHHVQIWVNGQPVLDERWDGVGWHSLEGLIPAGVLRQGRNQVKVTLPGDTGAPADVVFLDWIEISYPRYLAADQDRLDFSSSGQPQQLTGFSGPVLLFDTSANDTGEVWSIDPS